MVPVLFTFYVQGVLKLKNNSGAKRLNLNHFLVDHLYSSVPIRSPLILQIIYIM